MGIQIEADLTVGLTGATLQVHSEEGVLYIEARSFDALRELQTAADSGAVDVLRELAGEGSITIEMPVVVRVRGVPVGRYQPGEPAGRLAGWLGIEPFAADLRGVVRAAVRRIRPPQ